MLKHISSVFWIVIAITAAAVLWGVFSPDSLQNVSQSAQAFITDSFGWYYLLVVSLFVGFCLFLIFSPIGKIKLGKPDEKPEFGLLSWFAMLFSAGMGIGLVFYGAAEPISHYAISSPSGETETPKPSETHSAIRFSTGVCTLGPFMPLWHYALPISNSAKARPG